MKTLLLSAALLFTVCSMRAQEITGSWKGTLDVMGNKLEIIFKFSTEDGKPVAKMDVPAQSAKDVPMTVRHISADSVSIAIPMLTIEYTGKRSGEIIKGTFKQSGMVFPLDLTKGKAEEVKRPQTPKPPFRYETKEVTFTNPKAGATLCGTLSFPLNHDPKSPPPVVIFVSGSGAQDRDETIFEHKPFAVIADHLARHGIASLRYDDRGTGASTGRFEGATTADFAQDAEAGIEYLRAHEGFDKVGILGHSEGGSVAFMLGHKGVADFVIALAAPGVAGEEILRDQMITQSKKMGATEISEEFILNELNKLKASPWMSFFMTYDPSEDIRGTKVPTMAINGSLDTQVRASLNLTKIRNFLPSHPKNLIKEYPDLNHLFQHASTGHVEEYHKIEETISPEVLTDIVTWIKGL